MREVFGDERDTDVFLSKTMILDFSRRGIRENYVLTGKASITLQRSLFFGLPNGLLVVEVYKVDL